MNKWIGAVIRFIVSALVLLAVGYVVPGFSVVGFVNALIAAVVIAVLGYVIEAIFGDKISPQSRGIVGFITSAVVIYATQFFVPGLTVTILGALIAAFIIGVIDAFVPTELR
ncbi:MAG: putative rane protein [Halanaerobiales bacterium]|nr:putative rane protein [Halanaerobiales bacterium]